MLTTVLTLLGLISNAASTPPGRSAAEQPKLVVVLVVDQMRADYLDRFASQFEGGLGWLLQTGVVFADAHQDHAQTSTAPGHATIATGVFPSRHGIVGNEFYDRRARRRVYSVADSTCQILGYPGAAGRSPRNLLRDGLADWVREQSPGSRIFSVAIKDRAAIPPGGKRPDGVYWYEASTGDFVTSTYYRSDYPHWVTAFNTGDRAERYYGAEWTKLLPDSAYRLSREDDFAAESSGLSRTFPHPLGAWDSSPAPAYYSRLRSTPFGDELTLEFAADVVVHEGLGRDESPDLLFVGLSSADFIGHAYGPHSQEVQDYYLRLDRMLGVFIAKVEQAVPSGRFLIALSADHGVLPMPEELSRAGIDARRIDPRPIRAEIQRVLEKMARGGELSAPPRLGAAGGWYLDFGETPPDSAQRARLLQRLAELLNTRTDLAAVYTYEELASKNGAGELFGKFVRSFHPDRAADLFYAPRENYLFTSGATQTSHGSPYEYDTHVPLIFAGHELSPSHIDGFVRTVDLAPTVAGLMGIRAPTDLDGRDLGIGREREAAR